MNDFSLQLFIMSCQIILSNSLYVYMPRVCFITSSRADYGLLEPLIDDCITDIHYITHIIITGTHLEERYGYTVNNIVNNTNCHYVYMNMSGDKPLNIVTSMGLELINISNVLEKICPDIVVVLGDRYEILCAVLACTIFKIPVAHLCGGNITKGAYDDKIRHAITKLSHIHFVTDDDSEKVVRRMGESEVHICGNPGLEGLDHFKPIELDYEFGEKNLLLVYHPETVDVNNIVIAIKIKNQLLKLDTSIWNIFVIRSNADNDNDEITNIFKELKAQFILSLNRTEYLSLMNKCDVLVGNSSSFIFEAPILQIPVVIIGNRQLGRHYATNIIVSNEDELYDKITKASLLSGPFEIYYKPLPTREIVKNKLGIFFKTIN